MFGLEKSKGYFWLKVGVACAVGYMVLKTMDTNKGTLTNNSEGVAVKLDTDMAIDMMLAGLPPMPRSLGPVLKNTAKIAAGKLGSRFGFQQGRLRR